MITVITKDYPNLIIEDDYTYKIDGNLIVEGDLEIHLDKCLVVSLKIEAGDGIEVGGGIEAGRGIEAGLHIKCKGTLKSDFKIFAGICIWKKEIKDYEKTITCKKCEGEVESGILKLI